MTDSRILIVEDDPAIRSAAAISLRKIGYHVHEVGTLREGEIAAEKGSDLIVLDLNLPDGNGLDLCRKIAVLPASAGGMPVFIITSKGTTDDIVLGLEAGAREYMVKPFNMREFLARVRGVLRRGGPSLPAVNDNVAGKLRLSVESHEAWYGDKPLDLTLREFELLNVLIFNQGKALSRDALISLAWGSNTVVVPKAVDVHIGHLRAKLGDNGKIIETVPQVGFRIAVTKR
jgi:two-component system alkaline phosphatase synthesis response regulator PhoP